MKSFIIGEAWGREEADQGRPFVGAVGYYLNQLLAQVGMSREESYVTNVFNLRPPNGNDVKNLCGSKAEGIPGMPALLSGKFVRAQYAPELERLYREIETHKPNLLICMGATPTWALLKASGIKKFRGSPTWAHPDIAKRIGNVKVLPTYHPAAMMRDMTLRPIILSDLDKAKREREYPELRRPQREVWVEPTIADLLTFEQYLRASRKLSIDIETKGDQITCIGFAPTIDRAIVIPFWDPRQKDGNYWRTLADELTAWGIVKRWCQLGKECVFQNGLYDMHFLWRAYGITVNRPAEDTMLLHHALQPEMAKGLGFLGTLYTDEAGWKFRRTKHETVKRED